MKDSLDTHLQFVGEGAFDLSDPSWNPASYTPEDAWGDEEFHRDTIAGYEFVIDVLRRLL